MKSTHLTVVVVCHVVLASVVFYFTSLTMASPLSMNAVVKQQPVDPHVKVEGKPQISKTPYQSPAVLSSPPAEPTVQSAAPKQKSQAESKLEPKSIPSSGVAPVDSPVGTPQSASAQVDSVRIAAPIAVVEPPKSLAVSEMQTAGHQPALVERKSEPKEVKHDGAPIKAADVHQSPVADQVAAKVAGVEEVARIVGEQPKMAPAPASPNSEAQKSEGPIDLVKAPVAPSVIVAKMPKQTGILHSVAPIKVEHSVTETHQTEVVQQQQPNELAKDHSVVHKDEPLGQSPDDPVVVPSKMIDVPMMAQHAPPPAAEGVNKKPVDPVPVMGGLGPLHLLATTLCSYQPDKSVADENLNQLYARRASVRKSLLDFMSLKFTNLEKLSSRLGNGLQVVPVKSPIDSKASGVLPSHGWPVVGKCTAHDLKLMGEAAWCECNDSDQGCVSSGKAADKAKDEGEAPKITSNQHMSNRVGAARSISESNSFLPSPEESSVISKLLHVSDSKDAPTVESTIYNLNLTQHQLATLEAHATSTQECRRNSLRYTKALFNHLAEDQKEVSETWPKLYALISADDCARKRMIDIVNALSSFRTDTTSIRRDNLEFAFAMDDLRAKVLESEVNIPLSFDRHFIEVEQFLQQSVRLMLANVQPKRAKLTSMRYRSLMYGASNQAFDDQCIDLHQRLLARNYPNDCNPTQFGQLPDVLRMTASSLELWSIEKELSLYTTRYADYPKLVGQQRVKDDVNECVANLVSS